MAERVSETMSYVTITDLLSIMMDLINMGLSNKVAPEPSAHSSRSCFS
jgi:hypothetical protein